MHAQFVLFPYFPYFHPNLFRFSLSFLHSLLLTLFLSFSTSLSFLLPFSPPFLSPPPTFPYSHQPSLSLSSHCIPNSHFSSIPPYPPSLAVSLPSPSPSSVVSRLSLAPMSELVCLSFVSDFRPSTEVITYKQTINSRTRYRQTNTLL